MGYTLTPNLGLRVDTTLTADAKYNLNRIDTLAGKVNIALSGDTLLSSTTNILIKAKSGTNISPSNGVITLEAGDLGAADSTSTVNINARLINFTCDDGVTSTSATKKITFNTDTIDLGGATITNYPLAETKFLIGGSDGYAHAYPLSGDITVTQYGVATISSGAITGIELADNSVTTSKIGVGEVTDSRISDVSWSKIIFTAANITDIPSRSHTDLQNIGTYSHATIDAHIDSRSNPHLVTKSQVWAASSLIDNNDVIPGAAISYSKLNLSGQIVNADISTAAAIEMSKISGLVASLANKEPTVAKGDLTSNTAALTVSNGSSVVIGSGTSLTIATASAGQTGLLSNTDWVRFNALSPPGVPGDLTTSTTGITITDGTGAVLITTGVQIDIDTASAADTGLLSSTDWSTFNGKQDALIIGDITGTTNRTSVTGGTRAIIGTGVAVDIDTTLLPSPGSGDINKILRVTGANAATWQSAVITDEKIKISSDDITAGYLDGKLTAGTGISLTVGTPAGDETLAIANTDTGSAAVSAHNFAFNHANFLDKTGDTMTGLLTLDNLGILFDTTGVGAPSPAVEGQCWWNSDDHTINIQGDVSGSVLQVGQENWLRALNNTGAPIPEGAVVYISGANTARATIALAIASTEAMADRVIGVATNTIADSALGVVTTFGLVRGIATNVDGDGVALADGDPIYLSSTTAGEWVKAKPHAPNHTVKIGQIVNSAAGGAGNLFVHPSTGTHLQDLHDVNVETTLANRDILEYDSALGYWKNIPNVKLDSKNETGFVDPDNIGRSYDSTERKITLTHSSGFIEYYYNGTYGKLTSPWTSTAHTNTLDHYYWLTLSSTGTSVWTTDAFPGFDNILVARANYYTTDKFALAETHGLMDWLEHRNIHQSTGTFRVSGGTVPNASWTANTYTVAAVTPDTSDCIVMDEDLQITIDELVAIAPATDPVYTRVHFDTGVAIFTTGSTFPFPVGATNIQYNQNPLSGTALTEIATNNRFVNIYGIYVPVTDDAGSQAYRILWLTGQQIYTTLAAAQGEDFRSLQLGNLSAIFAEYVPFIRVTYQRLIAGGSGTTYNAMIPTNGVSYLVGNKQNLSSVTGFTPTDHNTLTGRTDADSHPASAISADTTNFVASGGITSVLSTSDTTVQAALDTLARGVSSRYVAALSWSGGGPYTMSIAAATHLRGLDPIVIVRETVTGVSTDVYMDSIAITDASGDVLLTSSENITGKVIIL